MKTIDNSMIAENTKLQMKEYWERKIENECVSSLLPDDIKSNSIGFSEGELEIVLPAKLSDRILYISNNSDLRLYMVLLTGIMIFYSKYSRCQNVMLSSPIFDEKENKNFINTLLLYQCQISQDSSLKEVLAHVKDEVVQSVQMQNYPLKKLIGKRNLAEDKGLKNLVDSVVLLENIHEKSLLSDYGAGFTFSFAKRDEQLNAKLFYDSTRFNRPVVEDLIRNLIYFLEQLYFNADVSIATIPCLRPESRNFLLEKSTGKSVICQHSNLIDWFESTVKSNPDHAALIESSYDSLNPNPGFGNNLESSNDCLKSGGFCVNGENCNSLSYEALNAGSNRFARYLLEQGIESKEIVAVMCDSRMELIPVVLGILKCNAVYLPIDHNLPLNRINYILKDCGAKYVISNDSLFSTINDQLFSKVKLIKMDEEYYSDFEEQNLDLHIEDDSPAYLIYTSGSTGTPKGTLVKHSSVCNYINWRVDYYNISSSDVTLQLLQHFFDGYYSNLFQSLLSGGTLLMVEGSKVLDFEYMGHIFKSFPITNLSIIPRILETLVEKLDLVPQSLRCVVLAGETASENLTQMLRKYNASVRVYNEYGPTETCIGVLCKEMFGANETKTIGAPIYNNTALVLDPESRALQPVGVPGELFLTGQNLAQGYLNQVELTDHCFGSRIKETPFYSTGDIVRYLSNGDIEFRGRADGQVKIRGFRIETGEIEFVFNQIDEILEGFVVPILNESGETVLCAYYKAKSQISDSSLRDCLAQFLPAYMIPAHFVVLDDMPLLPSGKVNKSALPLPVVEKAIEKPVSEIETDLVLLWSEVLQIEPGKIGLNSNFFELGGAFLECNATDLFHFRKIWGKNTDEGFL